MASAQQLDPNAAKLAANLVKDHLGDIPMEVFRALVQGGMQRFGDVAMACRRGDSKLTAKEVKDGLLLLLQHNCAVVWQVEEHHLTRGLSLHHVYAAETDWALMRLRMPRMLMHICDTEEGEVPELMVSTLLQNGRLQMLQLIDLVHQRLVAAAQVSGDSADLAVEGQEAEGANGAEEAAASGAGELVHEENGQEPEVSREHVRDMFVKLVAAEYIERVPPANLPPPEPQAAEPMVSRMVGEGTQAKRPRNARKHTLEEERVAERAMREQLRKAYAQTRFRLPEHLSLAAGEQHTSLPQPSVGKKRPRPESPGGPGAEAPDQETVLWRVNYEEFNRRFRHEALADWVRDLHGNDAATVLQAMLRVNRPYEASSRDEMTGALSLPEVEDQVRRMVSRDPSLTLSRPVQEVVEGLVQNSSHIFQEAAGGMEGGMPTSYFFCMSLLSDSIRLHHLQGMLRDRFGTEGLRVFRLLLEKRQLEQQQVGNLAMLDHKAARQLLFRMFRLGYLHLQVLPRTNSADHHARHCLFTWRADHVAAFRSFLGELYKVVNNVRLRLEHEVIQESELMGKVMRMALKGEPARLSARQQAQADRLRTVAELLEGSLLQLDEQIALFKHF